MRRNPDEAKRSTAATMYNKSGGNFDKEAKVALEEINKIKKPTATDDYRAGNILEFNVLQGHIDGHADATRMPLDAMLTRYTRAVGELGRQVGEHEALIRRLPTAAAIDIEVPFGVMILPPDALTMMNHLDELVELVADDILANPIAAGFINVVATEGPVIKQVSIAERKARARATAQSKVEEVDNYLEKSREWKSDPQNVHDSSVNSGLRDTIARIKRTCPATRTPQHSLDEAEKFMQTYLRGEKLTGAKTVLDVIRSAGYNTSLNESEANVFMYVWERAALPENEKNSKLIKEAVADALADSIDAHGHPVCMNGRCGRLIEALTLLDYDKETSAVLTTEMIRNNVFDEVRKMFDTEIEHAKTSEDPTMRQVGKYYAGESDDPVDDKIFRENIEKKIDIIIGEVAKDLSPVQLESLRKECVAAL